jgi:GNAT superfamily N-acetyltransferase
VICFIPRLEGALRELRDAPVEVVNAALEGHLELRRHYDYVLEFLIGTEKCFWVEVDGEVAAVQVIAVRDDGRLWDIVFTYVLPKFRALGIYPQIREHTLEFAKADPLCRNIEAHVKWDNPLRLQLERAGRLPYSAKYHTNVK